MGDQQSSKSSMLVKFAPAEPGSKSVIILVSMLNINQADISVSTSGTLIASYRPHARVEGIDQRNNRL